MGEVNVKMHMRDRSCSPGEQHGIFFYKPLHHMFRPVKIFDQLGSVVKNIEQEDPPASRPFPDHVNVFSEGLVVICLINGSVSITLYIVVKRYIFIPY